MWVRVKRNVLFNAKLDNLHVASSCWVQLRACREKGARHAFMHVLRSFFFVFFLAKKETKLNIDWLLHDLKEKPKKQIFPGQRNHREHNDDSSKKKQYLLYLELFSPTGIHILNLSLPSRAMQICMHSSTSTTYVRTSTRCMVQRGRVASRRWTRPATTHATWLKHHSFSFLPTSSAGQGRSIKSEKAHFHPTNLSIYVRTYVWNGTNRHGLKVWGPAYELFGES